MDVLIPSQRIGIEYDSKYHHLHRLAEDEAKTEIVEKNGYRLINLREEGLPLVGSYDVRVPGRSSQHEVLRLVLLKISTLVPQLDKKRIASYLNRYLNRRKFANSGEYREIGKRIKMPINGESLSDRHPKIAETWDYEKNDLPPEKVWPSWHEKNTVRFGNVERADMNGRRHRTTELGRTNEPGGRPDARCGTGMATEQTG